MWLELFRLLPIPIVNHLKLLTDPILEIRIRRGTSLCATVLKQISDKIIVENRELAMEISDNMMNSVIKALTANSLYSHENTIKNGYITVQGCYRVGVIGKAVCEGERILSVSSIHALNIRLWRQIDGIGRDIYLYLKQEKFGKSILIFSPPNMGKTTVVRDVVISLTQEHPHKKVALIDTRGEVAVPAMYRMPHLDILTNYPKVKGMEIATRVLSPDYIVCDEIGFSEEVSQIERVQNCGVPYIMTAHASSFEELLSHASMRLLYEKSAFDTYVGIRSLLPGGKVDLFFICREHVSL